jgi:hypothetical protein
MLRITWSLFLIPAAWTFKSYYDGQVAERALLQHTADSLKLAARGHAKRADSLAAAFRIDTVRLTTTVQRWRTLTDTLRWSDTITVPITVRESVIVAVADTAIAQCERTVFTCTALVASKDSMLTTVRAQLRNEIARRPGLFKRSAGALKWALVGAGLAVLAR